MVDLDYPLAQAAERNRTQEIRRASEARQKQKVGGTSQPAVLFTVSLA